jgi:hypothetical protein
VIDGWKHAFGDTPEGREAYANQLLMLMREYAKDSRCKGATLFCAGNQNRWGSFDVTGEMLSRLMAIQWPPIANLPIPPIVTPIPPPSGGEVTVKKHLTPQSEHSSSREGRGIQYLILHTTESPVNSDQQKTLEYLVENPLKVSINDYLARFPDGIIHQYNMVPYSQAAHHAGGAKLAGNVYSSRLPNGFRGHECNMRTIGLEIYRRVDQSVPADVIEAAAQWAAEKCKQFDLQTSQILSHAQVDPTRRSDPIGINMVEFRDRVGEILGAMVQVPPPVERPPLPEDEPLIDLTTFLQKSVYWAEEEIRQYQARQFARATGIRLSLAKYLAKGRDRWAQ